VATSIQPGSVGSLADAADTVAALGERGLAREAGVAMAFLALWLLERVESGQTTREQADEVFTAIDMRLSGLAGRATLSEASHDLVAEGEHFHHFGEEYGTDPGELRRLAFAILAGASA
jgi:hypothetical protein